MHFVERLLVVHDLILLDQDVLLPATVLRLGLQEVLNLILLLDVLVRSPLYVVVQLHFLVLQLALYLDLVELIRQSSEVVTHHAALEALDDVLELQVVKVLRPQIAV